MVRDIMEMHVYDRSIRAHVAANFCGIWGANEHEFIVDDVDRNHPLAEGG